VSRTPGLVYGFEEALGYLVNPGTVRDKDGVSAALAFLDLAASLAARGLTIDDQLDAFSERFGHFASSQVSMRVTDLSQIARVMARLRAEPPAMIEGIRVTSIDDRLEDGSRVMVRPSGTEPKLKVYLDTHSADGSLEERRATASAALATLERGMRALIAA
jgi:phosphomannomutase